MRHKIAEVVIEPVLQPAENRLGVVAEGEPLWADEQLVAAAPIESLGTNVHAGGRLREDRLLKNDSPAADQDGRPGTGLPILVGDILEKEQIGVDSQVLPAKRGVTGELECRRCFAAPIPGSQRSQRPQQPQPSELFRLAGPKNGAEPRRDPAKLDEIGDL